MARTLAEVAAWVGGTLVGDPQLPIHGAAPLADAREGDITLVDTAEKAARLSKVAASAAVVPHGVTVGTLPVIQVADVHLAFGRIVVQFRPPRTRSAPGISLAAIISPTARLAADVSVHPGATIGDDVQIGAGSVIHAGVQIMAGCELGEGVTVFPNAVLYENTRVGARTIIHAGAVLGGYGFGYKFVDGRHQLCAQLGNVEIGCDVEIGANTTIDRGTYGPTIVGDGTKIDNQVMIAHNCHIGRHNMICSQVGIAGSSSTGDYVVIAGQAGIRDHVHIGSKAVLGAMSGIMNDVPEGVTMLGIPATPQRDQKLKQVAFSKLPEMRHQVKALEVAVARLQQQIDSGASTIG
jgi:UDP-3-O-[3-hydroxymyristoyl] glucosamine N-acyltransferase